MWTSILTNVSLRIWERDSQGYLFRDGVIGGYGLYLYLILLSFTRFSPERHPSAWIFLFPTCSFIHLLSFAYQMIAKGCSLITTECEHLVWAFGWPLSCVFLSFVSIVLGFPSFLVDLQKFFTYLNRNSLLISSSRLLLLYLYTEWHLRYRNLFLFSFSPHGLCILSFV